MPFVHGGAEVHVRELVRELRARGYATSSSACRSSGTRRKRSCRTPRRGGCSISSESNGRPVDLVIASKFPTYFVRHPNKVAWLIHQYRAAYELCGTRVQRLRPHRARRRAARHADRGSTPRCSASAGAIFANARNTAGRAGEVQRPARRAAVPSAAAGAAAAAGPVRRLRAVGRPDRVGQAGRPASSRAMAHVDPPIRLIVAGDGTQRANVERAAAAAGVADRVTFLGASTTTSCIELYAGALAVVYPPFDEDFGYVTLEAFLARKPVDHLHRFGRAERVRRRRRQRVRLRAATRGAGRGDQSARRRSRRARPRWATPATTCARGSPGTA